MESKKITKREASQFLVLKKQLEKLNRFDEFTLFDQNTGSVNNFDFFSNLVEDKAKVYDSLNFLIQKVRNGAGEGPGEEELAALGENPDFFQKHGLRLYGVNSQLHLNTFDQIQFKMEGIFKLVEDYLDQLDSDMSQEFFKMLLEANLNKLRTTLTSQQSNSEKISDVHHEFLKIKKILEEKLEFERKNILRIEGDSGDRLLGDMDVLVHKGVMVSESKSTQIDRLQQEGAITEKIEVEVEAYEVASDIGARFSTHNYICFNGPNSYLSLGCGHGLSLKMIGETVYFKDFLGEMRHLCDVVYCQGAYYIYNSTPGRILRKAEDLLDPVVWWDSQKITNVWGYSKNLRVNQEQTALIVNIDATNFRVIEVRGDGTAGRELAIDNVTGYRINAFETLSNNRILTVNSNGFMVIHKVDYNEFVEQSQLKTSQIYLLSHRNEDQFWLSVCSRSEICAVQVCAAGRESRILIYQLRDNAENENLVLLKELDRHKFAVITEPIMPLYVGDLSNQPLQYHDNGCFSPYFEDKLILCTHNQTDNTANAFCYDVKKNELTENCSKSIGKGSCCWKLSKVGDQVVGIMSQGGFIVRFKFRVYSVIVPF